MLESQKSEVKVFWERSDLIDYLLNGSS